jgi:2-polyprenyl-3-methyl-5-hydroxy-6-metoxy-1,4-benzoquinol methylase
MSEHEQRVNEARELWDSAAGKFDEEPDHGLRDPGVRAAWTALLRNALPPAPGNLIDIGCGTGSLSLVLAESGYQVTGIDVSPAMIVQANLKSQAAGQKINFQVMDAAFPEFAPAQFDALICRHVLWSLPDIAGVIERWAALLKPGGTMMLIEGFWHTGAGLHADQVVAALTPISKQVTVQNLSAQPELWGGSVADERYAVIARK